MLLNANTWSLMIPQHRGLDKNFELVKEGTMKGKLPQVFEEMFNTGETPDAIIKKKT